MKDNYNDGVVYFYKRKNITNSFKAAKNVTTIEDLERAQSILGNGIGCSSNSF